ncbi:hypothetical protein EVAR_72450_1 [Eumeta japonica]|uniref:Uncharacterized protein n=1 Tax=Eumeta variegata TaxID=151549 RepID=A0A4C1TRN2_EUMVA|nr:hypothetical protein EVAR_72450_1 [Eumeta japonica]
MLRNELMQQQSTFVQRIKAIIATRLMSSKSRVAPIKKQTLPRLLESVSAALLAYEELETVIVEIGAILNSCPLTLLHQNHDDLEAPPAHFPLSVNPDISR